MGELELLRRAEVERKESMNGDLVCGDYSRENHERGSFFLDLRSNDKCIEESEALE